MCRCFRSRNDTLGVMPLGDSWRKVEAKESKLIKPRVLTTFGYHYMQAPHKQHGRPV